MIRCSLIITAMLILQGCSIANQQKPLVNRILTADEQAALTPEKVLTMLENGNERFVAGTITSRDHSAQIRLAAEGQFPKAVVLSCLDSRVPVEDVFDRGIGDIFVARVAGNFENTDILGSMEFATKVAGAKVVLVLGHKDCGAVKATIDGAELGNITAMLQNIQPAVDAVPGFEGARTSSNLEFLDEVTEMNVRETVNLIRENSPLMREMEDAGEIRIVGALYDMTTGEVEILD